MRQDLDAARATLAQAGEVPVMVVGSGKGGVGKSTLSLMVAQGLAATGRRVLLHDGAHNQGSLHVLLAIRPRATPDAVWRGVASPEELLVPVSDRLILLPAASGTEVLYGLGAIDRARLHYRLTALYDGFDAVVIDAGPGVEGTVRIAAARATRLLAVTSADPASLTDTYALIRIVHTRVPCLPIDVAVNRATEAQGDDAFTKLQFAARTFISRDLGGPYVVPDDAAIRDATCRPGALVGFHSPTTDAIAERLIADARSLEAGCCP